MTEKYRFLLLVYMNIEYTLSKYSTAILALHNWYSINKLTPFIVILSQYSNVKNKFSYLYQSLHKLIAN